MATFISKRDGTKVDLPDGSPPEVVKAAFDKLRAEGSATPESPVPQSDFKFVSKIDGTTVSAPKDTPPDQVKAMMDAARGGHKTTVGSVAKSFVTAIPDTAALIPAFGRAFLEGNGVSPDFIKDANYQDIIRGMLPEGTTLPPGQDPQGFAEKAANFAGGAVLPYAGALKYGNTLLKGGEAVGKNILKRMAIGTAKHPAAAAAVEGVSALGGAGGSEFANKYYPDSPSADAIFTLLGGVAAPMALNAPGGLIARGVANRYQHYVHPELVGDRASAALQNMATPEEVARLGTRIPGLNDNLSLGQQMRSPGVIATEQMLAKQDPKIAEQLISARNQAELAADGYAKQALLTGDPSEFRGALAAGRAQTLSEQEAKIKAAREAIKGMANVAGLNAQMAVQAVGKGADPEEIGRATRGMIDEELTHARAFEKEAWGRVNNDLPADYSTFIASHDDEIAKLSSVEADKNLIPSWAKERVDAFKADPNRIVGDLITLRRRFTDAARKEAGADIPNRPLVAYYNKMQQSLLDDLESVPGTEAKAALTASRELNDTFTRGPVGRLLGYEKTGELSTVPEATIREALRGPPEAIGSNINSVLKAAPQAGPNVEKFITNDFIANAFVDGEFSSSAAVKWLDKPQNRVALTRFPLLRKKFTDAKDMTKTYEELLKNGEISENALSAEWKQSLKQANVGDTKAALSNPKAAPKMIASWRAEIAGNEAAENGLKTDVIDTILEKSKKDITENDVRLFDRKKLALNLRDYSESLKAAGVTEDEMTKLRNIVGHLASLDTPAGVLRIPKEAEAGLASKGARMIGAWAGRKMNTGTIQVPGTTAEIAEKNLAKWTKMLDKTKAEISEAVLGGDERFKSLYSRPDSGTKGLKILVPFPKYGVTVEALKEDRKDGN